MKTDVETLQPVFSVFGEQEIAVGWPELLASEVGARWEPSGYTAGNWATRATVVWRDAQQIAVIHDRQDHFGPHAGEWRAARLVCYQA